MRIDCKSQAWLGPASELSGLTVWDNTRSKDGSTRLTTRTLIALKGTPAERLMIKTTNFERSICDLCLMPVLSLPAVSHAI